MIFGCCLFVGAVYAPLLVIAPHRYLEEGHARGNALITLENNSKENNERDVGRYLPAKPDANQRKK